MWHFPKLKPNSYRVGKVESIEQPTTTNFRCRRGSMIQRWFGLAWAHLGHCSYCIRKAFQAAIAAWIAAGTLALFIPSVRLFSFIGIIAAVGASGVWLAHLIAVATKTSVRRSLKIRTQDRLAKTFSRRSAIPLFARTLILVAVGSAIPRLSRGAVTCSKECDYSSCSKECECGCTTECSNGYAYCTCDSC